MKDHIIICGLGHIGFRSFELLDALGYKVAVITDVAAEDWRRKVESTGGLLILGDARSDKLLIEAGIETAAAVLAVTDQDIANVSIVMDSRRLNPKIKIICRLFDTSLGKYISEAFNVSQVFSTSELAAPVFCEAVESDHMFHHFDFNGQYMKLSESFTMGSTEIILNENDFTTNGPAAGENKDVRLFLGLTPEKAHTQREVGAKIVHWMLKPAFKRFHRILAFIGLVALSSATLIKNQLSLSWIDSFYFVTTTITTVGYGDFNFSSASPAMKLFGILLMLIGASSIAILFSVVADTLLSEKFSGLLGGHPVPRKDHVILVGGAHIGVRIAEHFLSHESRVAVIENDEFGRFPADIKRKVAVIEGDPRNLETLKRAGVENAKALLMVSDSDIGNLSVGLAAQNLSNNIKAIARIFDADLGRKLQGKISINKIFSVSSIAAPYFVAAILVKNVLLAFRWRNYLIILSDQPANGANPINIRNLKNPIYLKTLALK